MTTQKRRDARKLDHKTLEAIRIRAVEQVQAGESPEVVIRGVGIFTGLYLRVARLVSGGRLGRVAG